MSYCQTVCMGSYMRTLSPFEYIIFFLENQQFLLKIFKHFSMKTTRSDHLFVLIIKSSGYHYLPFIIKSAQMTREINLDYKYLFEIRKLG